MKLLIVHDIFLMLLNLLVNVLSACLVRIVGGTTCSL
jgi:hypothetical protein